MLPCWYVRNNQNKGVFMSAASGTQSRGQFITIIVLAVALAASVIALVVSLVQLTNEKHAIQSAADNAQVVTKEIAADSADLHQATAENDTAVADVANQAAGVAESTGKLNTDAAAQAKANAALKDSSDKVSGEVTNLTTAVTGIGTSLAAQQNASAALLSLVTDMQNDQQLGIGVLAANATNLSTDLQALISSNCPSGGTCTLTASDFNSIISEAASVSTGLTTQNDALLKNDPTVSAIAAAKSLNTGLTAIQAQGTAATAAGKTLLADMKTFGTGITDASTTAKKLSDSTSKLSTSATQLSKSAAAVKQSSSQLAAQGTTFNTTIQDLSTGTYTPSLVELSVPIVVLISLVGVLAILAALVIWLTARARKRA